MVSARGTVDDGLRGGRIDGKSRRLPALTGGRNSGRMSPDRKGALMIGLMELLLILFVAAVIYGYVRAAGLSIF